MRFRDRSNLKLTMLGVFMLFGWCVATMAVVNVAEGLGIAAALIAVFTTGESRSIESCSIALERLYTARVAFTNHQLTPLTDLIHKSLFAVFGCCNNGCFTVTCLFHAFLFYSYILPQLFHYPFGSDRFVCFSDANPEGNQS